MPWKAAVGARNAPAAYDRRLNKLGQAKAARRRGATACSGGTANTEALKRSGVQAPASHDDPGQANTAPTGQATGVAFGRRLKPRSNFAGLAH